MNLLAFSSLFLAEDGVVLGLGIGLGIAVVVALMADILWEVTSTKRPPIKNWVTCRREPKR